MFTEWTVKCWRRSEVKSTTVRLTSENDSHTETMDTPFKVLLRSIPRRSWMAEGRCLSTKNSERIVRIMPFGWMSAERCRTAIRTRQISYELVIMNTYRFHIWIYEGQLSSKIFLIAFLGKKTETSKWLLNLSLAMDMSKSSLRY